MARSYTKGDSWPDLEVLTVTMVEGSVVMRLREIEMVDGMTSM